MYYYFINPEILDLEPNKLYSEEDLNYRFKTNNLDAYLKGISVKYVKYKSNNEFKNKRYDALEALAKTDALVNFDNIAPYIPRYKLLQLKGLQREFNYSQVFINRIVDVKNKSVNVGILVKTKDRNYVAASKIKYNKYLDSFPVLMLRKFIFYLMDNNKKLYISKLIFGYNINTNKIKNTYENTNIKCDIVVATPDKNIPELESMMFLNHYMETGQKLTSMVEVSL